MVCVCVCVCVCLCVCVCVCELLTYLPTHLPTLWLLCWILKNSDAQKQLTVCYPPNLLVIQLKRFDIFSGGNDPTPSLEKRQLPLSRANLKQQRATSQSIIKFHTRVQYPSVRKQQKVRKRSGRESMQCRCVCVYIQGYQPTEGKKDTHKHTQREGGGELEVSR